MAAPQQASIATKFAGTPAQRATELGRHFPGQQVDLQTSNATPLRAYNTWPFVRLSARVNAGTFGSAIVTVEAGIDGQNWTSITTLSSGTPEAVDLDIEGYSVVRLRVSTNDAGASDDATCYVYGYSPPFDVLGPATSTDNAIARFDGTGGNVLQNSGVLIDDSDNITGVSDINDVVMETDLAARQWVAKDSGGAVHYPTATASVIGVPYYGPSTGTFVHATIANDRIIGTGTGVVQEYTKGDLADFLRIGQFTTTVPVTNTTSLTATLSVTVPGNLLGTSRAVGFWVHGDLVNNSGSNTRFRFALIYGATTVFHSGNQSSIPSDNKTLAWDIMGWLSANGATGSQRGYGRLTLIETSSSAVTGYGESGAGNVVNISHGGGPASEDSTGDLTFEVQVKHTVASASLTAQAFKGMAWVM